MQEENDTLFQMALDYVLANEGGLVDDPADAGGITNHGISYRFLKEIEPTASIRTIREMTKQDAGLLYYRYFYIPAKCNQMPSGIAIKVFDMAVNMGVSRAIKLLQKALVARGRPVKVDGVFGVQTKNALWSEAERSDDEFEDTTVELMDAICGACCNYYKAIVEKRANQSKFLRGWLIRANKTPNNWKKQGAHHLL